MAPNLVPEWCAIDVDRRLAPGEDPAAALAEVDELLAAARERGDDVTREDSAILLPAVETPADDPIIRASEAVISDVLGSTAEAGGVPYGTDGSNISGLGGVPCVVIGPGSIDQAHTEDEWVHLAEVERAAQIYESLVWRFASSGGAA